MGFNLTVTDENAAVQLRSTTDADFTFTNAYADAGRALKLTKIVNAPDTTGSFTFTVSYTDAGGKPKTESVTLKNGQSTTITGIPKGVQVTVTETTTDGYTVIMKDPSTGTVLAGSSSYTFTMSDDTAMDVYNTSIVALPETGGIGTGNLSVCRNRSDAHCRYYRMSSEAQVRERRVINAFVSSPAHAKYTCTRAVGTIRFH